MLMRKMARFVPPVVRGRVSGVAKRIAGMLAVGAGDAFARRWPCDGELNSPPQHMPPVSSNPLEAFFDAHREGRGIYKWRHYFQVYHRHLGKFVGRSSHVLEVGIYSGGSLEMWQQYFGPGCQLYGVDIEPVCEAYEAPPVRVFIGDQSDRAFWKRFRQDVPTLDVIIDDGGHTHEQQIATLEELLPHLRPGGVYICEDIHSRHNVFAAYVRGLARGLFAGQPVEDLGDPERRMSLRTNCFQSAVHSIHLYPFIIVIERQSAPVHEFTAPKHGTEWQPIFT